MALCYPRPARLPDIGEALFTQTKTLVMDSHKARRMALVSFRSERSTDVNGEWGRLNDGLQHRMLTRRGPVLFLYLERVQDGDTCLDLFNRRIKSENRWRLSHKDGRAAGYACATAYSPRAALNIAVAMVSTEAIEAGAPIIVHADVGGLEARIVKLPIV